MVGRFCGSEDVLGGAIADIRLEVDEARLDVLGGRLEEDPDRTLPESWEPVSVRVEVFGLSGSDCM